MLYWVLSSSAHGSTICGADVGATLKRCLQSNYSVANSLDYKEARSHMFSEIDNVDGAVQLVYSGVWFQTISIPNHQVVNTEHTWPQSKFNNKKIKTDLHHLYPTYNKINQKRAALPFSDIPDHLTEYWMNDDSDGKIQMPPEFQRDNYSEYRFGAFEPREQHKGTVARTMFYVYSIYGDANVNSNWFKPQIETLLKWHNQHPVTSAEIKRSKAIKDIQGNENPFIFDRTLASRLFEP